MGLLRTWQAISKLIRHWCHWHSCCVSASIQTEQKECFIFTIMSLLQKAGGEGFEVGSYPAGVEVSGTSLCEAQPLPPAGDSTAHAEVHNVQWARVGVGSQFSSDTQREIMKNFPPLKICERTDFHSWRLDTDLIKLSSICQNDRIQSKLSALKQIWKMLRMEYIIFSLFCVRVSVCIHFFFIYCFTSTPWVQCFLSLHQSHFYLCSFQSVPNIVAVYLANICEEFCKTWLLTEHDIDWQWTGEVIHH